MNNQSALVTIAMLSTFLSEKRTEYLDLLSPFVLSLFPLKIGAEIKKNEIISGLQTKYGLVDIPIQVLNKILIRLSKSKTGYLKQCQGGYTVAKLFDLERFEANQKEIRAAQAAVIKTLQSYLQEHTKHKKITEEKTQELFIYLLENRGLAIINGMRDLKMITQSSDYNLFHVAQFVIKEHENRTPVFDNIEELVRGFFVYKSIYFFVKIKKLLRVLN